MSLATAAPAYPQVQVPRCDGAAVVEPPLSEVSQLLAINDARREAAEFVVGSEPFGTLVRQARSHLIQAAIEYTSVYRSVDVSEDPGPLFLAGHQPEWFHSGVWFKNFVLHRLAQEHAGLGIQLLIDNDLLRHRSLLVPNGRPERAGARRIPFDDPLPAMPYEEADVDNHDLFGSFGERVTDSLAPFVSDPLITRLWPSVTAAVANGAPIGAAFAEARHRLEGDWGLQTLEVPLSHICDSPAFHQFAASILLDLERFATIYNRSLAAYRQTHRIRSHAHPAPPLHLGSGMLEAPFWVWTAERPVRAPLLVRPTGRQLELFAANVPLAVNLTNDPEQIVDQLQAMDGAGIKLRPRALLTTMYARLFLADLFIHGIGGGKYDQLTDQLITAVWGIEPPAFMVASATFRLPSPRPLVEQDDIRQIDGMLRELQFHPELADPSPEHRERFAELSCQKRDLICSKPTGGGRRQWHRRLEAVNEQLRELVKKKRDDLSKEKSVLVDQQARDRHMSSRDYSFSLFPESRLKKSLLDLMASIA